MPLTGLNPALKIESPQAATILVNRLVHLAKYQAIAELDNPNSQLTQSLEFELLDAQRQPFPDPCNVALKPGNICLRLQNNCSFSLNIAILNLESTGEISKIDLEADEPFYELQAHESLILDDLELEPPNSGNSILGGEILKLFAVKGLANFKWLTLPPLDEVQQTKAAQDLEGELAQKQQEYLTRGQGNVEINPLEELLATIGTDMEQEFTNTRKIRRKPNSQADWITKQIRIRFA